eukprot:414966_1
MPSLTMNSSSKMRTKKTGSKNKKRSSNTSKYNTNTPPNNLHLPNDNTNGSSVTQNPEFLGNRSPFYETVSRHIVMPICQKQLINFQFNLPSMFLSDINNTKRKNKKKKNNNNSNNNKLLHLRLFDIKNNKHCEMDINGFKLKINQIEIKLPNVKKNKNKKKNKKSNSKFRFVLPLDISKYASKSMSFEISCHKSVFHGAASIEIVNLLNVNQVSARVISRNELATELHKSQPHSCVICGLQSNLSRCSRCKAIWYCSQTHQQQDWNKHNLGCEPYNRLNKLKLSNNNKLINIDSDIMCNEIKVTIRDPLALSRIKIAVRGINCYHPQCIDLETYLNYCHNTQIWQCPICIKPLLYNHLVIDKSMNKIIKEIINNNKNVDQVRLNPDDYSYKIITLKEQQFNDKNYNNKKRKFNHSNGNSNSNHNGNACKKKNK